MKKQIFHIILSLLLTVAVTDHIWYDLQKNQIAIEIDAEKESKEELREGRSGAKQGLHASSYLFGSESFSFEPLLSGIFAHGGFLRSNPNNNSEELIILYCQLRLPCQV